ncbi:MAG: hypothetical protein JXR96_00400 [Deltaproteobacteria bacterium]|nr:hypothetical protein [Deltaproteobacteria bacterium]
MIRSACKARACGQVAICLAGCSALLLACGRYECADPDAASKLVDFEVLGQDIYPQPGEVENHGEQGGPFDRQDETAASLAMDPGAFEGVLWGGFFHFPGTPYCENEGQEEIDLRTDVSMRHALVGPMEPGQTYRPINMSRSNMTQLDTSRSQIFVLFREGAISSRLCPDFRSTAVQGTATVVSEKPFQIDYDLDFTDDRAESRRVRASFVLEASDPCSREDFW